MDLLPEIALPFEELNRLTKKRAAAVLALGSLAPGSPTSFEGLAGAFWADILFVTGRERASLTRAESDALAKVSAALGYNPVQSALLCADKSLTAEELRSFLLALSPQTLVFLEVGAIPAGETVSPQYSYPHLHVVTVTDFFGSLSALPLKQKAWQELKPATKPLALR
jgi:hypothetical protein